jgi:hypothetical protein
MLSTTTYPLVKWKFGYNLTASENFLNICTIQVSNTGKSKDEVPQLLTHLMWNADLVYYFTSYMIAERSSIQYIEKPR